MAKLGRGGMAAVFRAVHEPTETVVALKVFTPPDGDTTEFFKRAKREVIALQMCSHPNILKVHGFDFDAETGYVAVEHIEGKNLQEISEERGKLPLEEIIRVSRDIAGALAYIHARGLFHRDLKPANIMWDNAQNRCVLLDFGIVKATNLTQISGFQREVMGTLTYMAPEQFLSRDVDGRTDLYQLGLIVYRLATAADPPPVMDMVERVDKGLTGLALPLRTASPDLPESLENIVASLTNPNPDGRYPTAHDLIKDLGRVITGEPVLVRAVVAPRRTGPSGRMTGAFKSPSGRITGKTAAVTKGGPSGKTGQLAVRQSGPVVRPAPRSVAVVPSPQGPSRGKVVAVAAGVLGLVIAILLWLLRR